MRCKGFQKAADPLVAGGQVQQAAAPAALCVLPVLGPPICTRPPTPPPLLLPAAAGLFAPVGGGGKPLAPVLSQTTAAANSGGACVHTALVESSWASIKEGDHLQLHRASAHSLFSLSASENAEIIWITGQPVCPE